MRTLNLGILAHIDAGKTSLTEALLHRAGVLDVLGSVDKGTTHTDSLALERERGITIRADVVSFTVDGVTVNLIDTPGHPDFIAEVDRSLSVLDGAVLVVSAVEGVQAQTVVLWRALRRLGVPTVIFVNKVDRSGADPARVIDAIKDRLSPLVVPLVAVHHAGERDATIERRADGDHLADELIAVLIDHDDDLLAMAVDRRSELSVEGLLARLAEQTADGHTHPVFVGSAMTGTGVAELMADLPRLLPTTADDPESTPSGTIFKLERGGSGERLAYVRMFGGTLRVRDRVRLDEEHESTVTALRVFSQGELVDRSEVTAGRIAKVAGLRGAHVGDTFGTPPRTVGVSFAPPTFEAAVFAVDGQQPALHGALTDLAEQDPLIGLRQEDDQLYVSLYGEVQKEVIEHTLLGEHGIQAVFEATVTICVERPRRTGQAVERLGEPSNRYLATVGLSIAPGPPGGGVELRIEADRDSLPLYLYKSRKAFAEAMEANVASSLTRGLSGWEVTDAIVTLTDCGYSSPGTSASDFRRLTPTVLADALRAAGTVVCEPVHRFRVDGPADTLPVVLGLLARARAVPAPPVMAPTRFDVEGTIPADEVQRVSQQLRGLTHGEGVFESRFERYDPVQGPAPRRPGRREHSGDPAVSRTT